MKAGALPRALVFFVVLLLASATAGLYLPVGQVGRSRTLRCRDCHPHWIGQPELRAAAVMALVLAAGGLLYWIGPYLRRLTGHLLSVGPGFRRYMGESVRAQAASAGVRLSGVWLHPHRDVQNARAFGHWRRRHIVLDTGMLKLFEEDREDFAVIIEHEIGHIVHRDLDVAQAMSALWLSFSTVLTALVVSTRWTDNEPSAGDLFTMCTKLALLAVVVRMALIGAQRVREFHADAFAVREPDAQRDQERAQPEGEPTAPRRALLRLLARSMEASNTGWAKYHELGARRAVLVGEQSADGLTMRDAALLGFAVMAACGLITDAHFGQDPITGAHDPWLSLVVLVPCAAVLSFGIRQLVVQHCAVLQSGIGVGLLPMRSLLGLGAALSAGLTAGGALYPSVLESMWWGELTGSTCLGLGLTGGLTVLLLAAASLSRGGATVTAGRPRAEVRYAAFATLIVFSWFGSRILPQTCVAPVRAVVLLVPVATVLWTVAGRRRCPPLAQPGRVVPDHRPAARGQRSLRARLLLLCAYAATAVIVAECFALAVSLIDEHRTRDAFDVVVVAGMGGYLAQLVRATTAVAVREWSGRLFSAGACLAAASAARLHRGDAGLVNMEFLMFYAVLVALLAAAGFTVATDARERVLRMRHR
ncbi:M48 family metalloprotease [Streptomyces sp. NRRL F-2747]|uniref:M48 family metalloprotease n=1 Tax=Streptomyces sp. NRRL F-2747 TaxID=1463843 RepID=UPI0004C5E6B5|nr:M48 family metalloprotease [Streptomyces sp. NRRL F-2747]